MNIGKIPDLLDVVIDLFVKVGFLFKCMIIKHQNNVQNLFKVSNKDTTTTSVTSFWCFYC